MSSELVDILSKSPIAFVMAVADDMRTYEIRKGHTLVPRDFLEKWRERNWDSQLLRLLSWPGGPVVAASPSASRPGTIGSSSFAGGLGGMRSE